jgi:hypothetical protein
MSTGHSPLRAIAPLAVAVLAAVSSPAAFAEKSEGETPPEEQAAAEKYQQLPEQARAFLDYLQDLDARYPDSAKVDFDAFMATEGETFALRYCGANGIEGPCAPGDEKLGEAPWVKVDTTAMRGKWYEWLYDHSFNIGVIPAVNSCPAGTNWVEIHMDDEDRRNANNRWGWLGAIASTANTTYRFCKLDPITSLTFRPIDKVGDVLDYAVLNMGVLCPSGATRLIRVEENEIWRNANHSSGDIFPNFRLYNTSFNFYCRFDGGARSLLGRMNEFPRLSFSYGVFASRDFPTPFALEKGWVFQDDEDFLNWNFWIGSPHNIMGDGRNTWRSTARVR